MKRNLIVIILTLLTVSIMLIIGNVIVIGEKLTKVTGVWYAEYVLYGLLTMMFFYLLVWPMLRLHLAPEFPVLNIETNSYCERNRSELEKLYKSLMSNCYYLPEKDRKRHQKEMGERLNHVQSLRTSEIYDLIQNELNERFNRIDKKIREYGKTVFLVTSLSQNGRLDAIMVIVLNLRMIADIIRSSGYRPTTCQLFRQYVRILCTAFFSYIFSEGLSNTKDIDIPLGESKMEDMGIDCVELADADISSIISKIKIPGIATASLLDGLMNTLLTFRVGYVTKAYLKKGAKGIGGRNSKKVRREAITESIKTLKPMAMELCGNGAEIIWRKIKRVVNF